MGSGQSQIPWCVRQFLDPRVRGGYEPEYAVIGELLVAHAKEVLVASRGTRGACRVLEDLRRKALDGDAATLLDWIQEVFPDCEELVDREGLWHEGRWRDLANGMIRALGGDAVNERCRRGPS